MDVGLSRLVYEAESGPFHFYIHTTRGREVPSWEIAYWSTEEEYLYYLVTVAANDFSLTKLYNHMVSEYAGFDQHPEDSPEEDQAYVQLMAYVNQRCRIDKIANLGV